MKAKLLRSLYFLAVGLSLAVGVAGQTILKVGSILPPNSPEIQAITFMAEKIKEIKKTLTRENALVTHMTIELGPQVAPQFHL